MSPKTKKWFNLKICLVSLILISLSLSVFAVSPKAMLNITITDENGNYEFKCAPNAEVDAKLSKVDAVQACLKQNKSYNEGTHQCYTVQGEQLN